LIGFQVYIQSKAPRRQAVFTGHAILPAIRARVCIAQTETD
jgi:hypothetical protein